MLTLITPTGDRPQCMALLAEYVQAQTYDGSLRWLIVDDGEKHCRVPSLPNGNQVVLLKPDWCWKDVGNTQAMNLLHGLSFVEPDDSVLIIEDDDVYLPKHIATMVDALDDAELVGERISLYYNVVTRKYRVMAGEHHASLSSNALRGDAIEALRQVCSKHKSGIDIRLWKSFRWSKMMLGTQNVVGIKGMPGRGGIGVGHKNGFGDPDREGVLSKWIGPELAANYDVFGARA